MDDKQVEQQLTSRRLEINEMKLQVQGLLNSINKINNDIATLEENTNISITTIKANPQILNAYTSDIESSSFSGITNAVGGSVYARLVDLNVLRGAYETLRLAHDDLRSKLKKNGIVR